MRKLYFLIDKKYQSKIFILILLMIILSLAETLSIGSIIPLIQTILDSSQNNLFVTITKDKFSHLNYINTILFLIFSIFLIKNITSIIYVKFSTNFLLYLTADFQLKIYEKYMNSSLSYLDKYRSEDFIRNIITETRFLVNSYLSPLIQIFINILTIILFTILLLIYDFKSTLIILSFIISSFLVLYFIFYKKLEKIGKIRQEQQSKILKYTKDSFLGIRELKINNQEMFFSQQFRKTINLLADLGITRSIISSIPKAVMETIIILIFVLAVFYGSKMGIETNNILSKFAIYGLIGLKLLPMFNNTISNLQKINFSKTVLDVIYDNLKIPFTKTEPIKKIKFDYLIELRNINFRYNKNKNLILNNLNINIPKNTILGLSGKSGSGKSTLLDIISGLREIEKGGDIIVDGVSVLNDMKSWSNKIGYIQQKPFIFDESLYSNISLDRSYSSKNLDKFEKVIELSGLKKFYTNIGLNYESKIGGNNLSISGGELQRIAIARSLFKDKEILIFDESLSNLDEENKGIILNLIKKLSSFKTVIIVSHDQTCLNICNKVINIV